MSYHTFKASGQQFEIKTRYSLIRPIGHGAYGVVISALDKETGKQVAIKKISRAFEDTIDAKRILREIKLMKKFSHENVIRILDIIPPPATAEEFEDVYIVQDLMETDLHRIIYSKQPLTIDHIQYFIYQILRGLKYIHSASVLHRDLKICDFGLARGVEEEQAGGLTEYVVTRWYRAPEIMLACQEYTSAIDMWSVGCIFAELLARSPLFPGEDYIAQLKLICEKLGKPDDSDLDFVTSDRARRFINSLPNKPPPSYQQLFDKHKNETSALDLLKKMLEIHPKRRITIDKALEDPFLDSLHSPDDEPVSKSSFSFQFESEELSRERVQELIWEEIREYHHDLPESYPTSTPRRRTKQTFPDDASDHKAESKDCNNDKYNNDNLFSEKDEEKDEKAAKKRLITPESKK